MRRQISHAATLQLTNLALVSCLIHALFCNYERKITAARHGSDSRFDLNPDREHNDWEELDRCPVAPRMLLRSHMAEIGQLCQYRECCSASTSMSTCHQFPHHERQMQACYCVGLRRPVVGSGGMRGWHVQLTEHGREVISYKTQVPCLCSASISTTKEYTEWQEKCRNFMLDVRFEIFTAVTMKNCVFWDVRPCGSCKNGRFGGTQHLLHQGDKNR
jgi:hypothetical protein